MNDQTAQKPTAVGSLLSSLFPADELLALEITIAVMPLFEAENIQINDIPEKIRRIVLDVLRRQYKRIAEADRPMINHKQARRLNDQEWTRQLDEWKMSDSVAETTKPADPRD